MMYSSMRNHDPSGAAISFRQVMTPGSELSPVGHSRGPLPRSDSKTRRSPSTRLSPFLPAPVPDLGKPGPTRSRESCPKTSCSRASAS